MGPTSHAAVGLHSRANAEGFIPSAPKALPASELAADDATLGSEGDDKSRDRSSHRSLSALIAMKLSRKIQHGESI